MVEMNNTFSYATMRVTKIRRNFFVENFCEFLFFAQFSAISCD